MQRIGALVGHVARDPRRRAHVEVAREVVDRARADRRRHRVRAARHDRQPRLHPQVRGGGRGGRAERRARRQQLGQLGAVEAGQPQQAVVVGELGEVARVGDPVQRRAGAGGGGAAGELEAEPVDRLEEDRRARVQLGPLVLEVEDVAERVAAAERGRPAGQAQPARDLQRRVAGDRAASQPARMRRAARVEPAQRRRQRLAVVADGDGAGPLAGDGDRVGRRQAALGQAPRSGARSPATSRRAAARRRRRAGAGGRPAPARSRARCRRARRWPPSARRCRDRWRARAGWPPAAAYRRAAARPAGRRPRSRC